MPPIPLLIPAALTLFAALIADSKQSQGDSGPLYRKSIEICTAQISATWLKVDGVTRVYHETTQMRCHRIVVEVNELGAPSTLPGEVGGHPVLVRMQGLPNAIKREKEQQAEAIRLQKEMIRLIQKGAWSGADRAYEALEKINAPIPAGVHLDGAEVAAAIGNARENIQRVRKAIAATRGQTVTPGSTAEKAQNLLTHLQRTYGQTRLDVAPGSTPALSPTIPPFDRSAAKSISFAQQQLASQSAFEGFLPVGQYTLQGQPFSVT